METSISQWTINHLYHQKGKILDQPKYQRGKVWNLLKSQMLIDSILRGIDLPKFYLREVNHGIYNYEVADGQQRINAIKKFLDDDIKLSSQMYKGLDLSKISQYNVGGKKFSELNPKLQAKFKEYKITIAIVKQSTHSEIRTLFGRLQMGDPLTPPEIRNAIISNLGDQIDMIAAQHDFFTNSKIPSERFKRQDYLTHCFALLYYNNKYDLKAPILQKLYYDLAAAVPQIYIDKTVKVLTWMFEIDKLSKKRITNKWSFFDIFHFLVSKEEYIYSIDYKDFADRFSLFEKSRTKEKKPEKLIEGKKPTLEEKYLYNYIIAFKANGGNPRNITTRLHTFESIFKQSITLKK